MAVQKLNRHHIEPISLETWKAAVKCRSSSLPGIKCRNLRGFKEDGENTWDGLCFGGAIGNTDFQASSFDPTMPCPYLAAAALLSSRRFSLHPSA